ncbi:pilus assembly protein TadG-related protein [Microbacterium sp. NPDC096154]|uniref:pilus assembly protein TadG-related protein n=1 Tax=Microbacterium sp. NPDC096154 TaxID=3155549 RepID=UPI003327AFE1
MKRIDIRTAVWVVVLDAISYVVVYWLLLPAFAEVLAALNEATLLGITHVISAVRLVFVGVLAARSFRARCGFERRGEVLPSLALGATVAMLLQLGSGVAVRAYVGAPQEALGVVLLASAEWIVFPLLGLLFVQPGPADAARLRRRRPAGASERGAMSVAAIPAVAGLVIVATMLILMLGSATSDRRQATTAADAAALAAAQEWDRRLGGVFGLHAGAGSHLGFWGLAGLPVLGQGVQDAMVARASELAQRNDAELTGFRVDPWRREVTVTVRHHDTVPDTDERMEASATARIELTGGLCVHGLSIGYLVDGVCVTTPAAEPTREPEPEPTPGAAPDPGATPEPTPTPFEPPTLAGYGSEVVLVG